MKRETILLATLAILTYSSSIIADTPSFAPLYGSSDNTQISVGETFVGTTQTADGSTTTGYLTGQVIVESSSVTELANDSESYLIYPNPTSNILKVLGSGDISGTTVTIFSANGSRVINQPLTTVAETQLNLSTLSAGVYQLIITNANNDIIFKSKLIKAE